MTVRRSVSGFLAASWVALATAFVGVFFIPRSYCNELPTPTAEIVAATGVFVALGGAVLGMAVASFGGSKRAILVASGIGCLTIAAGLGVWSLALGRTAAWSCG